MCKNILIVNGNNSPISINQLIFNIQGQNIYFLNEIAKAKNFNNGETLVRIFADSPAFDFNDCAHCVIVDSLTSNIEINKSVNDVFSETELTINALKTKNPKIQIFLIATDFCYARQDRALNKKKAINGVEYQTAEPQTLKLKLQSLKNSGLNTLINFDPHSIALYEHCKNLCIELVIKNHENFISFFGDVFYRMLSLDDKEIELFFHIFSEIEDTSMLNSISVEKMKLILNFFNNELMLVAPDKGCSEKTKSLAHAIHQKLTTMLLAYNNFNLIHSLHSEIDSLIIKKIRLEPGRSIIAEIDGNAKNRSCLIIDDILDTGGTLCNAAEALKEGHGAKKIWCFITHGVLSGDAVEKLNNSCIESVNLTNSITSVYKKVLHFNKFKIYDLSNLVFRIISDIIKNNQ
jgi:phosphoribosylpyrophosphate synthetase